MVIEHIVPLEAEVAMLVELLADVEAAVEGLVVVTDYTVGQFVGIPDELGTGLPLLGGKYLGAKRMVCQVVRTDSPAADCLRV